MKAAVHYKTGAPDVFKDEPGPYLRVSRPYRLIGPDTRPSRWYVPA